MGTDLFQIANHKINFKEKSYEELANEIKTILDSTSFQNAEFLRLAALRWSGGNWKNVRSIREINTKRYWTYYEENLFDPFTECKEIDFEGPYSLSLTFHEHRITFRNPPYRYWQWIEMEDEIHRNEWRKYMYHIVSLFGGDRVIYLADNSHPLEEFIDEKRPFEETENALKEKFGEPKQSYKEVVENYENAYFIDNFKDIDWTKNEPLDKYLPEPDDTSSTNFDLKKYKSKKKLKTVKFSDKTLCHKLIEGEIHFYHIAVLEGLLCVHTGRVGKDEKIEVTLDRYAPFTYDQLIKDIEEQGFGRQLDSWYIINYEIYDDSGTWHRMLEKFEKELLWTGNGNVSGHLLCPNGENSTWFCAVDEQLGLKTLLDLVKRSKVTGKMKVIRKDRKKTIIYEQ